MRTGYLAADFGRPEGLNRTPECQTSFKLRQPMALLLPYGRSGSKQNAGYTYHRTGIAIQKWSQSHCKPKQANRP